MDLAGEGDGEMNGDSNSDIYSLMRKTDSWGEAAV